jgi:transposase InsO family protein
MRNAESLSQEQIREFLQSSQDIQFAGKQRSEVYAWVEGVLVAQEYAGRSKKERGLIRGYIEKISGLSVSQTTRLVRAYLDSGKVETKPYRRHKFAKRYSEADLVLLAEADRAHEWLSGPATRCILKREYERFSKPEYAQLSRISAGHLYNLRKSQRYRKLVAVYERTRPSPVSIGERRKPDPQGRPGFLRVDTVHQGDWDGAKGVYHINAVDTVTQWQVVGCTSKISEQHLLPVLEAMLHQFPFRILGFHADNGSEFINHRVAGMLSKLLAEFTKSRACRSQDNALVEGKNGAVIRKYMGYGHIAAGHAEALQKFYTAHLNRYLNFHRPCGFATVGLDARGKRKRKYKMDDYRTPYEKLKSLAEANRYLKKGMSFERMDQTAAESSDTECARQMGEAKRKLLRQCKMESPLPPRFD